MFKLNRSSILAVSSFLRSPVSWTHTKTIKELKLVEYGNPDTGVQLQSTDISTELKPGEVLLELKAASINPADINILQGKYGVLPESLPANIGNEGFFEVLETHASNTSLKAGDLVVPFGKQGWGTWRSHCVDKESQFYKIGEAQRDLPVYKHELATLTINPPTAFRLLIGIIDLKPGDTVIQNGANSGVGQAAIQLAKIFKINLVNIVRKRENQDQLNTYLKSKLTNLLEESSFYIFRFRF